MRQSEPMNPDPFRPRVLVSRCLLGEAVRYDGTDRRAPELAALAGRVDFLPVCPEAEAGLGVPRPPVQWIERDGNRRLRGVTDPALDVTDRLARFCRRHVASLPEVQGAILKARSPSCATGSASLFDAAGHELDRIDGLFVQALHERWPDLPCIDEQALAEEARRTAFIARIFARTAACGRGQF